MHELSVVVAAISLCLGGCGGGGTNAGPPPIAITVTPSSVSVETGTAQQFTATVSGSSNTSVVWAVNGTPGGNAASGTITGTGLYSAPVSPPSPAQVSVEAAAQTDPSKLAVATVTIVPAPLVKIQPASATVAAAGTQQFVATVSNSAITAVTWQVNGVAAGNSVVGTISNSGQYAAPSAATAVTVTAVLQANPPKTASASLTVLAPHRIGVRTGVDGLAELYDRVSGGAFTARGNNYIRLATLTDFNGNSYVYHSTFNVGLYDATRTETALALMQTRGFNTVRVFLNGCCVGSIGDPAGGLSSAYVANVVDFLERARHHAIYVIFTGDSVPAKGGYDPVCPQYPLFDDVNLINLCAGGVLASRQFQHDFVQALVTRGAALEVILAYELRNEYFYNASKAPLSATSGLVTAANGSTYDMSDAGARQRMMDEGLVYFTDQVGGAIREIDPTSLVTVGFFWPQSPNVTRVGDPRVISVYPAIAASTADFVDIHGYTIPGDLSIDQLMQNYGLAGFQRAQPVVMGEFGAFQSSYALIGDAAAALKAWQIGGCPYHLRGWLLWTWDTAEQYPGLWTDQAGDGSIDQVLAPASRPDPCAP